MLDDDESIDESVAAQLQNELNNLAETIEEYREELGEAVEELDVNLCKGEGTGSVQAIADNCADGIPFTGENPNAEDIGLLDEYIDDEGNIIIPYGATGAFSAAFNGKSAAIGKRSFANGTMTIAKGGYSHAEGNNSVTIGSNSHAEGKQTVSNGENSHAEGFNTIAFGNHSHSEGEATIAHGQSSHAEGLNTVAEGAISHAEGNNTRAEGFASHAEGEGTIASGAHQHVMGRYNEAIPGAALVIGNGSSDDNRSNAVTVDWGGNANFKGVVRSDGKELAFADDVTTMLGQHRVTAGKLPNTTLGAQATAEGNNTTASGNQSHAEGSFTVASGIQAHAEGQSTTASGNISHAEGAATVASGAYAHAEGYTTKATAPAAHAEGEQTEANGYYSHAEGLLTKANGAIQHVQGRANIVDENNRYLHIVGNGEDHARRSNAHTLDWLGNAWYKGNIKVGGTSYDDGKVLATEEFVRQAIAEASLGAPSYITVADESELLDIEAADGTIAVVTG
jgi:hypothetical protein